MGNAERQKRWRERRNALARGHPDVIEDALLRAAEHYEQLSADERVALADKLHDAAMRHFYVMHKLNKLSLKVRGSER